MAKGNLIYEDLGKNAFSFYRRRDGKSARLLARNQNQGKYTDELNRLHIKMRKEGLTPEEKITVQEARAARSEFIMGAELGGAV